MSASESMGIQKFWAGLTATVRRVAFWVLTDDIAQMKRREAELLMEVERLNAVFQSTGTGIVVIDREMRVVACNHFALNSHGRTASEVIGHSYWKLPFSALDRAVAERWLAATGNQPLEPVKYERRPTEEGGAKRLIKITANPVQDGSGRLRYIVLIGVDDTERHLAELQLFDTSRLANLGEMATGMAHEINQPLAIIRMAADSVAEELEMSEPASVCANLAGFIKEKLDSISSQTERASNLIRDLRAVAREPGGREVLFDLAKAAQVSVDLLRERLKEVQVNLTVELPPHRLAVNGEPSRLQQVLINVVLNARDAILDEASRQRISPLGHIVVRAEAMGDRAVITVEDDGPGIPPNVMPRLFEPFFSTKPTGRGTGLGLSISYTIIKHMDGEITAENRPTGGACFRISLPRYAVPTGQGDALCLGASTERSAH